MYKQIDSNKFRTGLLITIFLVFVVALGYFLSWYFSNYLILVIAVVVATVQALVSYYYSDSIALAVSRAEEAPREEPFLELHRIVENLAITAGISKPRVYIIEDPSPNAFATGRDPKHASIAVTTGLLSMMDKNELQGVIAHEMSHIANFDIRLATIVVVLVGVVALLSDWFIRISWFGGGRRNNDENGGQIGSVLMIIGIILIILAPIFATLIQLAISRKREYLADANGALLTRYPEGLASALEKIAKDEQPLTSANRATAHLYIADPWKKDITNLFATHPPIEERVKILRSMTV